MIDYKIYAKDLKKDKTKKIIVKIFENNKNKYIITTLQAIEDYRKTGFLPYDKMTYNKKLAEKLLIEIEKKEKYIEILDFLKSYNITKEDIKKDFLLYLLEYNIADNNINFKDVNNYLSGCYWDCFDNHESETNFILELIENVIYNEFKINIEE